MHVKPAAERHIASGHPWLFEGSIRKQNRDGNAGDLAVIFDRNDKFLAVGLYDPDSPIRVKILQAGQPAQIDAAFFSERIVQAAARRASLPQAQTIGYRLVHGENDGLPGFIVDRYDRTLVLKIYSRAWLPHLPDVLPSLAQHQPYDRLVLRLSRTVQDNTSVQSGVIHGTDFDGETHFTENGLTFQANVLHGHKTGFFFDQRDNRAEVRQRASGRVLDVFAYSGGFTVNAAAGGATHVTSVDLNEHALITCNQNVALNAHLPAVRDCDHRTITGDAMEVMERLISASEKFDVVIVDPPSMAKRADEVQPALLAYRRLAEAAMRLTVTNGLLVMASCSSRIHPEPFFNLLHQTANAARVGLDDVLRTGHAIDHPIAFSEGEYLKCLFARVRR